jgi:hypothetical protein
LSCPGAASQSGREITPPDSAAGALLVTITLVRPEDALAWIAVVVAVGGVAGCTWLIAESARPKLGVSD